MGADLYIRSIADQSEEKYQPIFNAAVQHRDSFERGSPEAKEAQKAVDEAYDNLCGRGYFRDSYGASMASRLGFSWWEDIVPMLDEEGFLQPPEIKELFERVIATPVEPMTAAELKEHHCKVDDDANSVESWTKGWEEQRNEFIAFLGLALDMNEPIECSL